MQHQKQIGQLWQLFLQPTCVNNTHTTTEEAFGWLPKSPIVSTILVPGIKGTFSPDP